MPGSITFPPLAETPQCSIIIPCLDEATYVESVVRAAMAQRYPPDLVEILVVDTVVEDGTGERQRLASRDCAWFWSTTPTASSLRA